MSVAARVCADRAAVEVLELLELMDHRRPVLVELGDRRGTVVHVVERKVEE